MCGIAGVFANGTTSAAALLALATHNLLHRGQEGLGIVTADGEKLHSYRTLTLGMELTAAKLELLPGPVGVAQTRYSTSGPKQLDTTRDQGPLSRQLGFGEVAVAHNGNLTNPETLFGELSVVRGSDTDTEVVLHLLNRFTAIPFVDRVRRALRELTGAYSFLFLSNDPEARLVAVRDPHSIRPLVMGRTEDGVWVVASETVALDIVSANLDRRDIAPGEMIVFGDGGMQSIQWAEAKPRPCIFEHIYFSRPDSEADGVSIYTARHAMGARLWAEAPAEADIVVPVPDSGIPGGLGYAAASGIPLHMGISRSHHVGRTFIEPTPELRRGRLRFKHNTNRAVLAGKRVVLIDDSIVRGSTSQKLVAMVREAGATAVHMRILSPPVTHPCFYGIDTPDRGHLIAAHRTVEEVCRYVGADSLAYLSLEGVREAIGSAVRPGRSGPASFCDACFTGEYPARLVDQERAAA